jgi:uncharacterized RDD family membrane protein YckC
VSDHYEELGVEPTATKDEIRDAHRARLSELEAARERKGVTESQLQANRDEAARVRTAWNVLSDPMQRQRYDQQLMDARADDREGGDVELVDDDTTPAVPPTGWRKLLAPPPPKPAAGAAGKGAALDRTPTPPSNRPAPTVELPAGMTLAEPRNRGMALLFDLAICMILYTAIFWIMPGLVQSDYGTFTKQADKISSVHDAQQSVIDAQKSLNDAKSASDKASAQKDLNSAKKDLQSAVNDAKKEGVTPATASTPKKTVDALDKQHTKLVDKTKTTQMIVILTVVVVILLYLVPITAIKGHTLGQRNRRLKVVRVDGSRVSWYAAFTRFTVPVLIAVAIPAPIGPVVGLGLVLWGYRDKNGQGVHDKLARTLVVSA